MKFSSVILLLSAALGQAQAGNLRARNLAGHDATEAPTIGETMYMTEDATTFAPTEMATEGAPEMREGHGGMDKTMSPSVVDTMIGSPDATTDSPETEAPTDGM